MICLELTNKAEQAPGVGKEYVLKIKWKRPEKQSLRQKGIEEAQKTLFTFFRVHHHTASNLRKC